MKNRNVEKKIFFFNVPILGSKRQSYKGSKVNLEEKILCNFVTLNLCNPKKNLFTKKLVSTKKPN